jgi:hypothetical protein
MKLPLEERTTHLWQAHEFCQAQLDSDRFTEGELKRNIGVLQRMLLKVAKHMAAQLREQGAWRDADDKRWPRNHKGSDPKHLYDTGAYPPQFLALPRDPTSWREVLSKEPDALFDEMIAWAETPAGQAGVGDEELQKLLADRDTYAPIEQQTDALQNDTPLEEKPSSNGQMPKAIDEGNSIGQNKTESERDRSDALSWLADKSADGSLSSWSSALQLNAIAKYLGGVSSNRRPASRILPELSKIEEAGEWALLHAHLNTRSPSDARHIEKLRACLSKNAA